MPLNLFVFLFFFKKKSKSSKNINSFTKRLLVHQMMNIQLLSFGTSGRHTFPFVHGKLTKRESLAFRGAQMMQTSSSLQEEMAKSVFTISHSKDNNNNPHHLQNHLLPQHLQSKMHQICHTILGLTNCVKRKKTIGCTACNGHV